MQEIADIIKKARSLLTDIESMESPIEGWYDFKTDGETVGIEWPNLKISSDALSEIVNKVYEVSGMGQLVHLAEAFGFDDPSPEGDEYTPSESGNLEELAENYLDEMGIKYKYTE